MTRRFNKGSRDRNEPSITELLRLRQVKYTYLHEGDGADLLIWVTPMEVWEVKDPAQPKSKRELTPVERDAQEYCATVGIPFVVMESVEQANDRLNELLMIAERR